MVVAVGLLTAACASTPTVPAGAPPEHAVVAGFDVATDTFAFANLIRARHHGEPHLYANYCFVMARSVRQFFEFARFDPAAPRLDHDGYVARVRAIVAHAPWEPAAPPADRVVIPGYANLRDFSRAQEAAVKEGLGGRFWTLVHWTNWRVTMPLPDGHQEVVEREIVDELRAGRLVQLLVTNWPIPELNHTVVAFGYREVGEAVDFDVWDPNDTSGSGVLRFDRGGGRFWAARIYDTRPGVIRVFRMYYSWLL